MIDCLGVTFRSSQGPPPKKETPPTVKIQRGGREGVRSELTTCTSRNSVELFLQRNGMLTWRADFGGLLLMSIRAESLVYV